MTWKAGVSLSVKDVRVDHEEAPGRSELKPA